MKIKYKDLVVVGSRAKCLEVLIFYLVFADDTRRYSPGAYKAMKKDII